MRILIAIDCDGTVDISGGPVPLKLLQRLNERDDIAIFIIGNWALQSQLHAPLASDWLGIKVSGLEYPGGGKSRALMDWKEKMGQCDRYIVVDDNPAQYIQGWDGWEFMSPTRFLEEFK